MGSMSAGSGTMLRRTLRCAGLTVAAGLVGGSVLVAGAGTTSAPEPANLGKPLGAATGSTAEARYVWSGTPTTVLEWPSIYVSGALIAPGTPCSTAPLIPGDITTKTIQALSLTSPQRRCA